VLLTVDLTEEEFERIEAELAEIEIHGNRTGEDIVKLRHLDRPARHERVTRKPEVIETHPQFLVCATQKVAPNRACCILSRKWVDASIPRCQLFAAIAPKRAVERQQNWKLRGRLSGFATREAELYGNRPGNARTAAMIKTISRSIGPISGICLRISKVRLGRERRPGNELTPRHMHREAGVAVVLSGGYEEAGDQGRFHVRAGDVVVHRCLDMHLDRFTASGAEILNLPATRWEDTEGTLGSVSDPDLIARLAERNVEEAAEVLRSTWKQQSIRTVDWPEGLAKVLAASPELCLGEWAHEGGLARATVTRGFKQVFGVTPSVFRAQNRVKLAWQKITTSDAPLCRVAADFGFSDQAHMTRAFRSLIGSTPSSWRAWSNRFKTVQRTAT
jgi:AraC-like DNA-binding protein